MDGHIKTTRTEEQVVGQTQSPWIDGPRHWGRVRVFQNTTCASPTWRDTPSPCNMLPCPAGGQALMGHRDRLPTETGGGTLLGPWTNVTMPGPAVQDTSSIITTISKGIPNPTYMSACPAGGQALVGQGDGRPTETDGGTLTGP